MNFRKYATGLLAGLTVTVMTAGFTPAFATVGEVGGLNIIVDAGNPSDGLRYLDMTYSDGLTLVAALTAATAIYPNARLATPTEFDDLFAAAGITYTGSLTASDGFSVGSSSILSSLAFYDGGTLMNQLGPTDANQTLIWTAPDSNSASTTTRDYIGIFASFAALQQFHLSPPNARFGWLIVSDAAQAPAPATLAVLAMGLGGIAVMRRKRSGRNPR